MCKNYMMHRKNICTYGPSENVEGWALWCAPCTPLYIIFALDWPLSMIFLYLIKPLHRKRKIYLSVLTWSPCWDWFCQCFFFIRDNDTLIFGVPNSYFPFSIGFFSFFRFCDAPCEKEETAFICASDGSLYRFLLFTKIERFSKHF